MPGRVTQYEDFIRLARLFRQLELRDLMYGARIGESLVLRFDEEAKSLPEYRELTDLLDLDPDIGTYTVVSEVRRPLKNTINLRFRSFAGIMYFLSQSVEVPASDVAAGRVTVTLDGADKPFDWGRVSGDLMLIRSIDKVPENAAVEVRYRGSWFYIDDSDLDSKSTFSMLMQLFALQSGNADGMRRC